LKESVYLPIFFPHLLTSSYLFFVQVTNLMPTQKSSWRGPDEEADVMLNTRRDTRWRANGVVRIA